MKFWRLVTISSTNNLPASTAKFIMPRTKSSKTDDRSAMEKLNYYKDSKLDLFIFFKYYDGIKSDGMDGFKIGKKTPIGSVFHMRGTICEQLMTTNSFSKTAKKLVLIARQLIDKNETPPDSMRPTFTPEDYAKYQEQINKKNDVDPIEVLQKVTDEKALFVFFNYYDGLKSMGRRGFSKRAGGFGSVAHARLYPDYFSGSHGESWFHRAGKKFGKLAKKCVDDGIVPPENLRPSGPKKTVPQDMVAAFDSDVYGSW